MLFSKRMPAAAAKSRHWQVNFVEALVHWLDRMAARVGRAPQTAPHLLTGKLGEEAAFFELQRHGYTIIARNWRCADLRGDLDLVGWSDGLLCFVEVKTRTRRDGIPAEFAVNFAKKKMLRRMARAYLRRQPERDRIPVRFDVLSIYIIGDASPEFELRPGAFSWR